MLLFVGTPNLLAREARLQSKLRARAAVPPALIAEVITFTTNFLTERWDEVRFMTFAENEAFANAVVDLVVRK